METLFYVDFSYWQGHLVSPLLQTMIFLLSSLKDMEKTLDTVQNIQGNCLQELEGQLKKQREIAAMTHSSVENEIISNLFEIAINCDDGDMHLSDEEIKHLITRIEAINGVTVKKLAVLNLIESHGRDLMGKLVILVRITRTIYLRPDLTGCECCP